MFELVTVIFIFISDEDIQLHYQENNTLITRLSREVMHTQYEWLFINMIVTNKTNRLNFNQTSVVYTVSIFSSRDASMETVPFAYVTGLQLGLFYTEKLAQIHLIVPTKNQCIWYVGSSSSV